MVEKKKLPVESMLGGSKHCVSCGNNVKENEFGGRCELIECPEPKIKKFKY